MKEFSELAKGSISDGDLARARYIHIYRDECYF